MPSFHKQDDDFKKIKSPPFTFLKPKFKPHYPLVGLNSNFYSLIVR